VTPVHFTDPNWVNYCLWLAIRRKARELAEIREKDLVRKMALFDDLVSNRDKPT
jgi:hypothetical protein